MAHLEFVRERILRLEAEIARRMEPYVEQVTRVCDIPGVDVLTAWTLIAELGPDRSAFPTAAQAASWAGLCPGNPRECREAAGKPGQERESLATPRFVPISLGVTREKNCYLQAHFLRRAAKSGVKKAIIATAHQMLVIAYHLLRDGGAYRELGGGYYDCLHPLRTRNRLIRRLERLGLRVVVTPVQPTAPAIPDRLTNADEADLASVSRICNFANQLGSRECLEQLRR